MTNTTTIAQTYTKRQATLCEKQKFILILKTMFLCTSGDRSKTKLPKRKKTMNQQIIRPTIATLALVAGRRILNQIHSRTQCHILPINTRYLWIGQG